MFAPLFGELQHNQFRFLFLLFFHPVSVIFSKKRGIVKTIPLKSNAFQQQTKNFFRCCISATSVADLHDYLRIQL